MPRQAEPYLTWKWNGCEGAISHLHRPFFHKDHFTSLCGIYSGALNGAEAAERRSKCRECIDLAPAVLKEEQAKRDQRDYNWLHSQKRQGLLDKIRPALKRATPSQLEEIERILKRDDYEPALMSIELKDRAHG